MDTDDFVDDKKKVPLLIGFAGLLSIGILIEILACVFWGGWWLLLVAIVYLFLPLPRFLCGQMGNQKKIVDWTNFLTGMIAFSGFGIPIMLLHSQVIPLAGFIAGMVGGAVACGSIGGYIMIFHKKNEDDMDF